MTEPTLTRAQTVSVGLFLGGRLLWMAASQIFNVAVGWLVYDQTRSAWALGLVGLVTFLPRIPLTLLAGVLADRFDRRRVIAVALSVNALAAFAAMAGILSATPGTTWIYACVLLYGVGRAFVGPAAQSLIANLIPRDSYARVMGLSSSVGQIASITGPALGGLLYVLGAHSAVAIPGVNAAWLPFAVAGLAFTLGAGLNLATRPLAGTREERRAVKLRDALAGVRFIAERPVILGAISLDLFAVLFGGATALLPMIVAELLHEGPEVLGLLRAMPAVGALMVAGWLAWRPLRRRVGVKLFAATAIFGLATVGLAFSHHLGLTLGCLWLIGASDVISVVVRQTLVQADTPDSMRGRVAAVNSLFIGASNELGEFESGSTAALLGLAPAILAGGLATVGIAAIWAVLFPDLRRRDAMILPQPQRAPGATVEATTGT